MKKRHDKDNKVRIYINPETFYHLCQMAAQAGLKHPGQVVDKIVRTMRECEK